LAGTFVVAPFRPEHAKAFRGRLPPRERQRLEALLRAYAPGKVRYTLPAVYYRGAVDLDTMMARLASGGGGSAEEVRERGGAGWEDDAMMLALPSLGVHIPGLESLVEYEVRYRKVDAEILDKCYISNGP